MNKDLMFLDDHQFHFIENLMPGKRVTPEGVLTIGFLLKLYSI